MRDSCLFEYDRSNKLYLCAYHYSSSTHQQLYLKIMIFQSHLHNSQYLFSQANNMNICY